MEKSNSQEILEKHIALQPLLSVAMSYYPQDGKACVAIDIAAPGTLENLLYMKFLLEQEIQKIFTKNQNAQIQNSSR